MEKLLTLAGSHLILTIALIVGALLAIRSKNRFALLLPISLSSLYFYLPYEPELPAPVRQEYHQRTALMYQYHAAGKKEAALIEARAIEQLLKNHLPVLSMKRIEAVHHIGWLLWDTGQDEEAHHTLSQSLELYQQKKFAERYLPSWMKDTPPGVHGIANEHYLLGSIEERNHNFLAAEQSYRAALHELKQYPQHRWYYDAIYTSYERLCSKTTCSIAATAFKLP